MLKHNETTGTLDECYRTDKWWYLDSPEFREAFLKPLGARIDRLGMSCLDVGCGVGQLARYVTVPYCGIDASEVAIEKAQHSFPNREFYVGRMEQGWFGEYGTVVFGGILEVMVRNPLEMFRLYENVNPSYFIVYDMEHFNHKPLNAHYELIDEYHASADIELEPDVKRHRKILTYKA